MSFSRLIVGSALLISLAAGPSHADLVAHWRLNEGEGEVFTDSSSGGNDGFLPEDVTVEWIDDGPLDGILDTSVLFTGDDGPSFIETPFVGIGGADPRTITAWVKSDPQTRATAVVAYGSLANGRKWHFRVENTRIRTEFQGGQNFGGDTDAADGEWHHIATVFPDGATEGDDILHYIDGVLEPQLGGTSRAIDTGIGEEDEGLPVHIGFAVGHAGRFYQGQISDVRFYDEGLDQASIADVMAGAGFLPPGTLPGDFNGDETVDMADFLLLSENFNTRPSEDSYSKGDLDLNLKVDLNDFLKFRLLLESQVQAASVPEPNNAWCLWLIVGVVAGRRRARRS